MIGRQRCRKRDRKIKGDGENVTERESKTSPVDDGEERGIDRRL